MGELPPDPLNEAEKALRGRTLVDAYCAALDGGTERRIPEAITIQAFSEPQQGIEETRYLLGLIDGGKKDQWIKNERFLQHLREQCQDRLRHADLRRPRLKVFHAGIDWGHPYGHGGLGLPSNHPGETLQPGALVVGDTHIRAALTKSEEEQVHEYWAQKYSLSKPLTWPPIALDFGFSHPSIARLVSPDGTVQAEIQNLAVPDPHDDPAKKAAYYGLDADSETKHVMAQCRVCGGTGGSDIGLCRPCKGSGSVNKALQDTIEYETARRHREALTGNWRYVGINDSI